MMTQTEVNDNYEKAMKSMIKLPNSKQVYLIKNKLQVNKLI